MHIAKTAGSAINETFEYTFGKSNCITHAEGIRGDLHSTFSKISFLSGHMYYPYLKHIVNDDVYLFTIIREPIAHLASHILWLDHYNLPEKKHECAMLNKSTQDLVYQIKNTNLEDYKELDYLLVNLEGFGLLLLDNCQTRYFMGNFQQQRPLTLEDSDIAINIANRFNRIIFQDNFKNGINALIKDLSLEEKLAHYDFSKKVNEAKSLRKIDIEKPIIRKVLDSRISVDNRLYNTLKTKFASV